MIEPSIEHIVVKKGDLQITMLPRLRETVFHVTTVQALEAIMRSGMIRSNRDGRFDFTFPQSKNNYGRQRGYVCLFDLRSVSDLQVQDALRKFYFLHPKSADPAFLLLHPSGYPKLIPWTVAPAGVMLIPHVETWYPSDLPTTALASVMIVTVEQDDADSAYRATMRHIQRDKEELLDTGTVCIGAASIPQLQRRTEAWVRVAREGGLRVNLGWDEDRVEDVPDGYMVAVHADRPDTLGRTS